jgi:hypothetical protein
VIFSRGKRVHIEGRRLIEPVVGRFRGDPEASQTQPKRYTNLVDNQADRIGREEVENHRKTCPSP